MFSRRSFFAMLAGVAAAPAAIAAAFKPKPALPPIPELPGFHTEWVKPPYAVCQLCGLVQPQVFVTTRNGMQRCLDCDMNSISGVTPALRGDPLMVATDVAYFDRDISVTVVFSRHPDGTITLHDSFEHTAEEIEEVGLARLERGDVLKVRREMTAARIYNEEFEDGPPQHWALFYDEHS